MAIVDDWLLAVENRPTWELMCPRELPKDIQIRPFVGWWKTSKVEDLVERLRVETTRESARWYGLPEGWGSPGRGKGPVYLAEALVWNRDFGVLWLEALFWDERKSPTWGWSRQTRERVRIAAADVANSVRDQGFENGGYHYRVTLCPMVSFSKFPEPKNMSDVLDMLVEATVRVFSEWKLVFVTTDDQERNRKLDFEDRQCSRLSETSPRR